MPGFSVNGEGGNTPSAPGAGQDMLRDHRFKMVTFMDMNASQAPFYQIKDVDLPEKIIEVLEIKCPGTTYKFAKSASYTDLKLTFYGTQELASKIKELEHDIHNVDTGVGDFNQYLKDVVLQMYDGEESEMITFTFKGCWLSNSQWGNLSYGSSELKLITVVVKCHFYEIETASE